MDRDQTGISTALSRMADSLGRLIGDHLTLARLEITEDARTVGRGLAGLALFVPLVLIGWAFVCIAASLALTPFLGAIWAPACVGAANLVVGGFGIARAVNRLRGHKVMDDSISEVGRSASALSASLEAGNGT